MARSLRDSRLDTREGRLRLRVRSKPYARLIEPGLHLLYRRLQGRAGSWALRRYLGSQRYTIEALHAIADDFGEADGKTVMSFRQAQRVVLATKPKAAGAYTVRDAVEAYIRHLTDAGKATAQDCRYRADAHILPQLGDVPLGALTAPQLRAWLAALARVPGGDAETVRRRRASANRVWAMLTPALNLAHRSGHADSDKAWRTVERFKGVNTARLRYLSVAEAQRLVNACGPGFRELVQAALVTGARYGELSRVRAHDFSADSSTLAIPKSKGGRPRHVPLTTEGAAMFRRWTAGLDGNALVLTHDGGKPWAKSDQQRLMRDACTHAKISPPIGFHQLRHSYASLAVMAGAPLVAIAAALGHRDTRMCEQHYAHLSKTYVADAIRAAAPKFGFEHDDTVVPLPARRP
jgi:integrase